MKLSKLKAITIAVTAMTLATNTFALSRSQKDTAVGAVLGGVAGAFAGQDITSTVAGAALGGVVGSQWNAHKRDDDYYDRYERHRDWDRYEHRPRHHKARYEDHWKRHKHHHKKKHRRHHDDDDDDDD